MTACPNVLLWLPQASDCRAAVAGAGLNGKACLIDVKAGEPPPADVVASADILFAWDVPVGTLSGMPRLRWVQAATAGVDNWLAHPDLADDVVLTCARGIHKVQMPENILGSIFHVTKPFTAAARHQAAKEWGNLTPDLIAGKTLAILGLGDIGAELARKASALGMRVIGVRRSCAPVTHVDEVFSFADMHLALAQADYIVLLMPVTPDTDQMLNAQRLSQMKRGAWLFNFGRGQLIVDDDLIAAVRNRHLAGAVLDAFREEPLPPSHPFWSVPGITVLPHIGGRHPQKGRQIGEVFAANLQRFLAGETLSGVVDRSKGY